MTSQGRHYLGEMSQIKHGLGIGGLDQANPYSIENESVIRSVTYWKKQIRTTNTAIASIAIRAVGR